jgi:hypothetical protein
VTGLRCSPRNLVRLGYPRDPRGLNIAALYAKWIAGRFWLYRRFLVNPAEAVPANKKGHPKAAQKLIHCLYYMAIARIVAVVAKIIQATISSSRHTLRY